MIRVLVVEDSTTTRQLLISILGEDPEIQVVGEAKNGLEAVELTGILKPDVVAMDIEMPEMNGFEATKRIMVEDPTPIVIISTSRNVREAGVAMQALKAGALTVLKKPGGPGSPDNLEEKSKFVSMLKTMSHTQIPEKFLGQLPEGKRGRVVAIATSTGGPPALNRIFSELPGDFPAPILVVQHMLKGFMNEFASWMNGNSSLRIKVAAEGEELASGTVYLAGYDRHLGVSDRSTLFYSSDEPIGSFRPSGTFLFESVAKAYGPSALALVLTGMGSDGVAGLKAVKEAGGRVIAQDQASSVIFGMPGEAIKTGYTDMILPLEEIAPRLMEMISLGAKK
jgi:two-component system chemotaxis response regulator CheB